MSRVYINKLKEQEIDDIIKSLFDKIIGHEFLKDKKKVLIKPNLVVGSPASCGATTDLSIVKSFIKLFKEKGMEVIVGENSLEDTDRVFKELKIAELEKFGAKVVNFSEGKWIKVESQEKLALKSFHLPEIVFDCDLILSIAKMKAHDQTGVTLSIKNVFGMIPQSDRKVAHMVGLDKSIVDIFAYLVRNKPFISVVDGIYAMEGRGSPTHGKPVKMDLIIAGDDPLATDATCAEVMGVDPRKVRYLSISEKMGLGQIKNRVISGEKIESVMRKFEMASSLPSFRSVALNKIIKKIFKRTSYQKYKERCNLCKLCVLNCPLGNITIEEESISINTKKCIGCMVCIESCTQGALDYKIRFGGLYKIMSLIRRGIRMWRRTVLNALRTFNSYKRTIRYLSQKRGFRAVYNFLYIKSFVAAGGEGTGNLLGKIFIEPLLRISPPLINKIIKYPFTIEIEITNRCNKKCILCEHTYWNEPNRDLSYEDFKKIISQFPKLKWVNLTGEGDAFLNKDYLKMIAFMKNKDIPVFLVDSFDLLDKKISKKLINMNLDGIWISWDAGTKDTYEKIKVGCKFDRSLNNIKDLIELKKEKNTPIPEICFRYIVNTFNVNEMPQFIELIHSLGSRSELGDGSRVEFVGLLVFDEVKDYYVDKIPNDVFHATLEKGRELDVEISMAHISKGKLAPLERCKAWLEPYIMMGGYVLPCCAVLQNNARDFLRKYAFGNILETPFKEIWNSERYRKFRQMIPQKNGKVPILCRGCRAFNTLSREECYGASKNI